MATHYLRPADMISLLLIYFDQVFVSQRINVKTGADYVDNIAGRSLPEVIWLI